MVLQVIPFLISFLSHQQENLGVSSNPAKKSTFPLRKRSPRQSARACREGVNLLPLFSLTNQIPAAKPTHQPQTKRARAAPRGAVTAPGASNCAETCSTDSKASSAHLSGSGMRGPFPTKKARLSCSGKKSEPILWGKDHFYQKQGKKGATEQLSRAFLWLNMFKLNQKEKGMVTYTFKSKRPQSCLLRNQKEKDVVIHTFKPRKDVVTYTFKSKRPQSCLLRNQKEKDVVIHTFKPRKDVVTYTFKSKRPQSCLLRNQKEKDVVTYTFKPRDLKVVYHATKKRKTWLSIHSKTNRSQSQRGWMSKSRLEKTWDQFSGGGPLN